MLNKRLGQLLLVCAYVVALGSASTARAAPAGAELHETISTDGASRTIFLWGVGSEEEASTVQYAPEIRHRGDFMGQCLYTMEKVERLLATRGASLADVTTLRTYVTDARNTPALHQCLDQYYPAGTPRPALTVTSLYQLAHAGMMVEIEATASLPTAAGARNFTVYRNAETQGRWNLGAIEIMDVSGPSRTLYVSGLRAVEATPEGLAPLFPHDFMRQCEVVHRTLKDLLASQGATSEHIVRTTAYVGSGVDVAELFRCRAPMGPEYLARAPGSLAGMTQLGALGETYIYDVLAVAPLRRGESARRFTRTIAPSEHDPRRPAAIVVSGPRRVLTITGVGPQNSSGDIEAIGDFASQCRVAFANLETLLAQRRAGRADLVKLLVYLTDNRNAADYEACTDAVFGDETQPAQTIVAVPRASQSGMLIQIEAIAVTSP